MVGRYDASVARKWIFHNGQLTIMALQNNYSAIV